jgi:hypothetical protein
MDKSLNYNFNNDKNEQQNTNDKGNQSLENNKAKDSNHTEDTSKYTSDTQANLKDNEQSNIVHPVNTPGNIVLQWVTYAFWGWTVLTMSFLTAAVIAYFINDSNSSNLIIYGLAGVAVLMPISITCDYYYKKENQ